MKRSRLCSQPCRKKGLCAATFLFTDICIHLYFRSDSAPTKPSKSALKKAAKTARTEKRQQQKASKTRMSDHSQEESSSSGSPHHSPATLEPVKTVHESYDIIPVADEPNDSPPQDAPDEPPPQATAQSTGAQAEYNIPYQDGVISSADQSYPTSMEPSGRNSPEPSVRPASEKQLQGGVDAVMQLALQNKEAERTKTKQNAVTRTIWGFAMIGGFIGAPTITLVWSLMLIVSHRFIAYGTCIYDHACPALPNTSLP